MGTAMGGQVSFLGKPLEAHIALVRLICPRQQQSTGIHLVLQSSLIVLDLKSKQS